MHFRNHDLKRESFWKPSEQLRPPQSHRWLLLRYSRPKENFLRTPQPWQGVHCFFVLKPSNDKSQAWFTFVCFKFSSAEQPGISGEFYQAKGCLSGPHCQTIIKDTNDNSQMEEVNRVHRSMLYWQPSLPLQMLTWKLSESRCLVFLMESRLTRSLTAGFNSVSSILSFPRGRG